MTAQALLDYLEEPATRLLLLMLLLLLLFAIWPYSRDKDGW